LPFIRTLKCSNTLDIPVENETEAKKDWKTVMKEHRKELYQKMKANRKKYLNQPDVRERLQIMKYKRKNRRKAILKEIREKRKQKQNKT
jgi:hypothetical protein